MMFCIGARAAVPVRCHNILSKVAVLDLQGHNRIGHSRFFRQVQVLRVCCDNGFIFLLQYFSGWICLAVPPRTIGLVSAQSSTYLLVVDRLLQYSRTTLHLLSILPCTLNWQILSHATELYATMKVDICSICNRARRNAYAISMFQPIAKHTSHAGKRKHVSMLQPIAKRIRCTQIALSRC